MGVRHSQDTVGMQRAGPVAMQLLREAQGTLCLKCLPLPTAASHRPLPGLPTGKNWEQTGMKSLPDAQRLLNTLGAAEQLWELGHKTQFPAIAMGKGTWRGWCILERARGGIGIRIGMGSSTAA